MLHNLRIHQKFISNVTERVRAGRVNALGVFAITLAGLVHELQQQRGLSAVSIGNPSSGPQNVNS